MTLLTDKQRDEVVEAAFDALWPLQDWGMDPNVCRAAVMAALTAALPAIERAVLERAAWRVEDGIAGARKIGGPFALIEIRTRKEAASDIRALAGEVG